MAKRAGESMTVSNGKVGEDQKTAMIRGDIERTRGDMSRTVNEIEDWKPHVRQDPAFMRPAEVDILLGDSSKAERVLGWERKYDLPGLVRLMVQHDVALQKG